MILSLGTASGAERILYLSSGDSAYRWMSDVLNSFLANIRTPGYDIPEVEVYELGVMHNPKLTVQPRDAEFLREALKQKRFDLIVSVGNPATDLLFSENAYLGATPVVFCAYTGFDRENKVKMPKITGLTRSQNLEETLRLGLLLLPQTQKIAVITDGSSDGEALFREFHAAQENKHGVEIVFLHGAFYGTEEMLDELRQLPEKSFVVLDNWRSAKPEPTIPPMVMERRIMQSANCPIFLLRDTAFMSDALGGVVVESSVCGVETAKIVRRILNGEDPEEIPIQACPSRMILNWKSLNHWGIPLALVPKSATIIDRKISPWYTFRVEASAVALTLLIVLTIGVIVSAQRRRGRKRLNGLFAALPIHVGVVDLKGRILFYQAGNAMDSEQRPKRFSDLPLELLREIESPIAELFKTGEAKTLEYGVFGTHRQLELLRLPHRMFGRDTVMWISADVTTLHEAFASMTRLADRSRLILNSIGDAVIVTDGEGNITQMNPMAEKLTGRKEQAVAGLKLEEVFQFANTGESPDVGALITGVLRRGEELRIKDHPELLSAEEMRYRVAVSASPVKESDGEITGAVLFFHDVTDEDQKRAMLDAQNTILRNATEVANIVYFSCDHFGKMTPLGDFDKHWACKDGEPIPPEEWIVPEDLPFFRKALKKILSGETESMRCYYSAGATNSKRHYEMRVVKPATSDGKEHEGEFYGIIQDVTELVRQKEQLREAMETAQAANHAKSRFITAISSELRSPLDAVIGFSELLQLDGISEEEKQQDLQAINLAGRTMLSLANNVLDLAEMETDKLEIQSNPTNLKELFSEMVMIFRQTALGRGLRLKLIMPEQSPWVMLDQQRFRQILINLIGSAIKSIREGSVVITVKFDKYKTGDSVGNLTIRIAAAGSEVKVTDNVTDSDCDVFDENNLELVLSRQLCTRMGGTLNSYAGEGGCTAIMTFENIVCMADSRTVKNTAMPIADETKKKNQVIIVDDVAMNVKVMSAMFTRLGIPHSCCSTAHEAIREIGKTIPAVVFTDLWMPDMGGDELAEFLSRDPSTAKIPIVVVTADQQMDPALRSHFSEVLLKPLTLEALKECLKRLEEKKLMPSMEA
jgi:PAS domain S-box-containing protein